MIKNFLFLLNILSFAISTTSLASDYDTSDDFIENIFEVKIPGIEGAYNASIIECDGGYLMAFRYDTFIDFFDYIDDYHQYIGIIRLNENFQPQGSWIPCLSDRTYDPRLININGTYHLIFASPKSTETNSIQSSHLEMCTFQLTSNGIAIQSMIEFSVPFQQKWEKNWVPFVYKNKLHLSYTIDPHIVLRPSLIDGKCQIISNNKPVFSWDYGIIRGGTPALLVDDHYLAFFHSSKLKNTNQFEGFNYSIGAYTYSSKPPFKLLNISKKPFNHPDFYSSEKGPLSVSNVLFPGGFVMKGEKIYLCYGENDTAIKIMVINKKLLYKSLGSQFF